MLDHLNEVLRKIPKVDLILEHVQNHLDQKMDATYLKDIIDHELIQLRHNIIKGTVHQFDTESIIDEVVRIAMHKSSHKIKRVINGTGIVLHTNLGRSVLSKSAIRHLAETMMHYNNLEFNLDQGRRGSRYDHIESLLCELTQAEAAIVVNNNAAAVMLILNTFAQDKEVIISRGELIEIGGAFRIPNVMKSSGAILKEVGTTNKTHLYDFEEAVNDKTGLILKVHTSNYEIVGFTSSVPRLELSKLAHLNHIPFYEDLGSGSLIDLSSYGLKHEASIPDCLTQGVDLVSFSGDKLLGASQAGIIVGKKIYIDKLKKNQLLRALRIDKLSLVVLEDTLRLYLSESKALENIPTLKMLTMSSDDILEKVNHFIKCNQNRLDLLGMRYSIESVNSTVGGGALPTENLPSFALSLSGDVNVNTLQHELRQCELPVVCTISDDALLFDFRTIMDDDYEPLMDALEFVTSGDLYD